MAKVALLIGVSEYDEPSLNPLPGAIQDIKAMQRVLQHPDMGGFAEADITVLENPQRQAMEEAIEKLFSNCYKDDLVLLYFSGHGIKDDSGRLFLATSLTHKNGNGELIKTSATAASTIHDVMENSRSRRQVIILDCCFSGAFAEGMKAKDNGSLDIKNQLVETKKPLEVEGRAVLTSSTATQYSFEQKGEGFSIYTHYLVEGIETGTADTDNDGMISVNELHEYARKRVQEVAPNMKPGIYAVREGYKIQLAKTRSTNKQPKTPSTINKINFAKFTLGNINNLHPQTYYLHNFLEPYESFINELITRLKDENLTKNSSLNNLNIDLKIENRLLEIIRQISESDFVFILQHQNQDTWMVQSRSEFIGDNFQDYIDNLKVKILPNILQQSVFNSARHGIYQIHECKRGISNAFVVIPLISSLAEEIMVVCGIHRDSHLLGDAYSRILSTFYQQYTQKSLLQPELIEAAIIDDLKRAFGFVSVNLYERRFNLFYERLQRMVVHFEPVIHLDAEDLFISGWEALARNPESLTAPSDLFQAAELWGPRFTIELDQHFLRVATESYRQARKTKQRRAGDIVPLSVNVYPESLIRSAYFETVSQILKAKVISPRNLILEISEKTALPEYQGSIRIKNPLNFFKNKLLDYVSKLKIRFAIDDFGVGYASVSRLAGLSPSHVKIDREILHHQPGDVIIRFVHEIVGANNLNPAQIIIEGVDEHTPISLHRLKALGVSYVQGHIVGRDEPEVYRLSYEKTEELKKRILGESF
ncbi:EAL domain-containing protein [Chlorogloeopsis sp. ULAP01]|uniref:caspase, EACC1-associated type n=1 Tax=Chlorogloeopsis sp. ULAP01 TaxID=3056483 RepID=UPI0025AB395D|nr:EAL domain-containing protein [Chlorogloeopsis sp. ULAP01]MDM9381143.1 EAL domain-containing protein [Chlorogloeopsis sp. ULAP01]